MLIVFLMLIWLASCGSQKRNETRLLQENIVQCHSTSYIMQEDDEFSKLTRNAQVLIVKNNLNYCCACPSYNKQCDAYLEECKKILGK